jgi:hypothetical protein
MCVLAVFCVIALIVSPRLNVGLSLSIIRADTMSFLQLNKEQLHYTILDQFMILMTRYGRELVWPMTILFLFIFGGVVGKKAAIIMALFHSLRNVESYNIHAPYILIECKNYESEIGNAEIDQIGGRLDPKRSSLGILAYRKSKNYKSILKKCRDWVTKECYIIPLDDNDIISMLNSRLNNEDVNEHLHDKMQDILFA